MSLASVFSRFRPAPMCRVLARTARTAGRPPAAFQALLLAAAALVPGAIYAQNPGSQDTSFVSALTGSTIFGLTTEYVGEDVTENIITGGDTTALTVLDGKGLNLGDFTSPEFGGLDRLIYTIVPELFTVTGETSPRLLIGGTFGKTKIDKVITPARNIERIDLAGVIDTGFDPGNGADDFVTAILPQSDGTIFVGGQFTEFNKQSFPRLVRLNNNGSVDTDFHSVPVGDGVFALAAQINPATGLPNGQVIIGGTFSNIGNNSYTKLARVDQAGNVDSSFKPVIDSRVLAIAAQPDGKIVIGGEFTSVNGQTVNHLARLNQDGSLDPTFGGGVSVVPAQTSDPVAVYVLNLLPDGRIYVGGNFSAVDGVTRNYLGRIETDGSLDTAFDPGTAILNSVQSLAVQLDNRVLVGETVSKKINNIYPPSLIRLYGDSLTTLSAISLDTTVKKARQRVSGARKNGVFKLTRTGGNLDVPLNVYFEVSGTAQSGVAYRPLAASQYSGNIYRVTFAANQTIYKIKVKPLMLDASDAPESLTLTLLPSPDSSELYETGTLETGTLRPGSATGTVKISNSR